jgi:hypothetical protein
MSSVSLLATQGVVTRSSIIAYHPPLVTRHRPCHHPGFGSCWLPVTTIKFLVNPVSACFTRLGYPRRHSPQCAARSSESSDTHARFAVPSSQSPVSSSQFGVLAHGVPRSPYSVTPQILSPPGVGVPMGFPRAGKLTGNNPLDLTPLPAFNGSW